MQNHERLTPGERELERALAAHVPAATGIDRDRLMFQAGRAAGRRRGRLWQGATVAMALLLGFSALVRTTPRVVERIVEVPVSASPAEVPSPTVEIAETATFDADNARSWREQAKYVALCNRIIDDGVEALPSAEGPGPAAAPRTLGEMRGIGGRTVGSGPGYELFGDYQ